MPGVAPEDRQVRLTALRNAKMADSAHAYVRGSTVRFYEWLDQTPRAAIPDGPPVWICGDCHVGNLGPIAAKDGSLDIAIRDLDQTVIGNPAHDLMRLSLSLAMAARGSDLPGVTTVHMLERLIEGYGAALENTEHEVKAAYPETVKLAMRRAAGRSWKHLADERIEGVDPVIPLGTRFWPLAPGEKEALGQAFGREDVRRLITSLRSRQNDAPVRLVDAAYWRKGCSSLGRLRFAALVAVGKGKALRHCLIDLKEAVAADVPSSDGSEMPQDNGERVAKGAKQLSPDLGERLLPLRLMNKALFMRELLPQDLKLEIEVLSKDEAMQVAEYLGAVVGRAHGRQMSQADRQAWCIELRRNRSKTLDAPSWLWSGTVDLAAAHEAAYLEHCRRHVLALDS